MSQSIISFERSTCKISLQLPLLLKKTLTEPSTIFEECGASLKTKQVLSSPYINKYESTNSTSNCDVDDEVKVVPDNNQKLRLKLKKRVRLESEEDYTAVICLLNLQNKRQRISEKIQFGAASQTYPTIIEKKEKSHKLDQITLEKQETVETGNLQENIPALTQTSSEQSIIIKLPSLTQHTQLSQALSYGSEPIGAGVSGIQDQMTIVGNVGAGVTPNQEFFNSHFTIQPTINNQYYSNPTFVQQQINQNHYANTFDLMGLQAQYLQYNNLLLN
eukprot:403336828